MEGPNITLTDNSLLVLKLERLQLQNSLKLQVKKLCKQIDKQNTGLMKE